MTITLGRGRHTNPIKHRSSSPTPPRHPRSGSSDCCSHPASQRGALIRPRPSHHLQSFLPWRLSGESGRKLLYLIIPFLSSRFYLLIYSRSQPALAHSPAIYFYKFSGIQPPLFIHLLQRLHSPL